jgi:hypothetical protein
VAAEREGDLRVLPLQALDLRLDALDQHAGEQVHRNDADLHHAQPDLALHDGFEARPGDAGEGEVDQFVLVGLEDPARHPGQLAVGAGVGRAAPEQDDAGGHADRARPAASSGGRAGLCSTAKISRPMPRWRVTANSTCGWRSRARFSAAGNSILTWPAALRMKGMTSTLRRHAQPGRDLHRQQHFGVLDEADLDPPVGVTFAPLGGEMQGFLVAVAVARAVADEEEGGFISHDSSRSPCGSGA